MVTPNRLRQYLKSVASNDGLTLIECLVAIIMVALVASAITPALVISVATRVQNQKAEQALTLAQTEIDRVRLAVERREARDDNLPPSVAFTGTFDAENRIAEVDGPLAVAPVETPTNAFQTRLVNLNGNEFAVQTFRSPGKFVDDVPVVFTMGVRVYDTRAMENGGGGNLPKDPASLGMTGGEGQRSQRPLAALYTTVAAGENSDSLCSYIKYFDSAASTPLGCQ
jgi:prepilin-type N-terminal cleavage/methylation domain-containing protein